MPNRWLAAVVVVVVGVAERPRAATADVSADDAMGALADVVSDRARKVAARMIKRHITDHVCPSGGRAVKVGKLVIHVGGRKECAAEPDKKCRADDVFVKSCRLLRTNALALTDPFFLEALGRDAVALAFRLAARSMDQATYEAYALGALSDTAFDLATALVANEGVEVAAANTLDAVATSIGRKYPATVISELASDGTALYTAVRTWIANECPKNNADRACFGFHHPDHKWVDVLAPAGQDTTATLCKAWRGARDVRDKAFETLFGASGPYHAYREGKRCGAPLTAAQIDECIHGRVLYNLFDHATKVVCAGDDTAEGHRRTLRQLAYQYAQKDNYEEYLKGKPALASFEAYVARVEQLPLTRLPAEELANLVRVVAGALRATTTENDKQITRTWVDEQLRPAVDRLLERVRNGDPIEAYHDFVHGPALARVDDQTVLNDLKTRITDLVVLPYFYYASSGTGDAFAKRLAVVLDFLRELRTIEKGTDLRRVVVAATRLLKELGGGDSLVNAAKVRFQAKLAAQRTAMAAKATAVATATTGAAKKAARAAKRLACPEAQRLAVDGDAEVVETAIQCVEDEIEAVIASLEALSAVIADIGERNWIGIAVRLADSLEDVDDHRFARTLKFLRVLMEVYQADTREQAREVFAAALDDESSREERFDRTAVDIGAMLGFTAGLHYKDTAAMGETEYYRKHGLLGLYAPVGVQITHHAVGVMLYPVDVGAYMVGSSSEDPEWSEAIRVGGLFQFRLGKYLPIDLFLGADYQPSFGTDEPQLRVLTGLALELPLFGLN